MRRIRIHRRHFLIGGLSVVLLADALVRRRSVRTVNEPGLLIVQVDGLGLPVLRRAIAEGQAPFLAGLIERAEATLGPWSAMLPPTTPASQAGILHGHNDDIPGFRWYEKSEDRLLVANHAGDAAEIVRRQSDGHGLLAPDGASIGNLMTGDARRTYLTMATVAEEPRAPGTIIRLRTFLASPLNAIRIVLGMLGEFTVELYQSRRQLLRNVQPRMHRGFDSATERAFLNGSVRILSTELTIAEMRRGTPVIYVDFTGYDSIAHHSGPERPESLQAVRGIDREIERLMSAMPQAKRPYRLVVLSDHGQSLGQPFEGRYGQSLEDFVAGAMGEDITVRASREAEHNHGLKVLTRELGALMGLRPNTLDAVGSRLQGLQRRRTEGADDPDLVVCASGNLAHLYFPVSPNRMTSEEIEQHYPGLITTLVNHAAVGVVFVRSGVEGPLVISPATRVRLDRDQPSGDDPLAPYGPLAAASLRRLDGFGNVGDIVLLSTVDPVTEEVISFEDLVGCHGGLGGAQSEPFLLHSNDLDPVETPLIGAPSVNLQLRHWLGSQN